MSRARSPLPARSTATRPSLPIRSSYVVLGAVFGEGMFFFCVFPFVGAMLIERGSGGPIAAGVALAGFAIGGALYGAVVRYMIRTLGQWNMMRAGGLMAGCPISVSPSRWGRSASRCFSWSRASASTCCTTRCRPRRPNWRRERAARPLPLFRRDVPWPGNRPVFAGVTSKLIGFSALFLLVGVWSRRLVLSPRSF